MALRKILRWLSGGAQTTAEGGGSTLPFSVAISIPGEFPDEHKVVRELFDAGLTRFHVRKPDWHHARLIEWVGHFPTELRSKIVVHAMPELVLECKLGGLHLRSFHRRPKNWPQEIPISHSCHSYRDLAEYARHSAYATIGPVFASISKRGYTPQRTPEEYAIIAKRWSTQEGHCPLLALGGLTSTNIGQAREMGFDGFAVVGSVWDSENPVEGFKQLLAGWKSAGR
ncbi:MAG: thiamine phosphate synthase [Puniceicoccales bacterium]|jgi:thiamine-phosphate pyrophosphorylase|nr:thiamine phosphate synthase [Puniceicoccales bacterium]